MKTNKAALKTWTLRLRTLKEFRAEETNPAAIKELDTQIGIAVSRLHGAREGRA